MALPKKKISKRRRKSIKYCSIEQKFEVKKRFPEYKEPKSTYELDIKNILMVNSDRVAKSPYTASQIYLNKWVEHSNSGTYVNKNKFTLSKTNRKLFWLNKKKKELHRRDEIQKNIKLRKKNEIGCLELKTLSKKNWAIYKKNIIMGTDVATETDSVVLPDQILDENSVYNNDDIPTKLPEIPSENLTYTDYYKILSSFNTKDGRVDHSKLDVQTGPNYLVYNNNYYCNFIDKINETRLFNIDAEKVQVDLHLKKSNKNNIYKFDRKKLQYLDYRIYGWAEDKDIL